MAELSQRKRLRLTLAVKIGSVLALCIVVSGAATAWVAAGQLRNALVSEFRSKGEGISRGLATVLVPLIVREEQGKIVASAEEFSRTGSIAYVLVNDPAGQILASAMHREAGEAKAAPVPTEVKVALAKREEMQVEAQFASQEIETAEGARYLDMSFPIMNGGLGRAHVGLDLSGIEERVVAQRNGIVGTLTVLLALMLGASWVFTRLLVRPMADMSQVVNQISTGDLQAMAQVASNDEFSLFGDMLNQMINSLRGIVSSVRKVTAQVNEASEEILATARHQERSVGDQVAGLEEISQTMGALADTARAIAENTLGVTQVSMQMSEEVQRGTTALHASRDSVEQIVEQNTIIVDRINKLYEQSESIIAVIDIIDNISDRLDLLALNAALEGTRAGEVGKGFSLVAAEMRRLAESVSESTKEIKGTIQQIHALVRGALEASQTGTDRTRLGAQEMQKTVDIMSRIFGLIDKTAGSTQQITVITQQQLSSSQQIAMAMRDVAIIATQGVEASREVSRAAADLARLSQTLQDQVSVFRVAKP